MARLRTRHQGRRAMLAGLAALPALAAAPAGWAARHGQAAAGQGTVAAVPDGATLALADGPPVRLAGIEAPGPPGPPALAEAARIALAERAQGRVVLLHDAVEDRQGRRLAQVERDDGLWLQGALLDLGLARVRTRPDAASRAPAMLAAESRARDGGLGLWNAPAYAVRPADPRALGGDIDSFQIVEGRVVRAMRADGAVFLDFGEDWRRDVSVRLDGPVLRALGRTGIDPLAAAGAIIRVRGWVGLRNGPMIAVSHPEQIEWPEGPPAPATEGGDG